MIKNLIIDRFEGVYAVCEYIDENTEEYKYINIDKKKIDSNATEGDSIVFNDKLKIYCIDEKENNKRREYIENIFNNFKK